MKSLKLMAFILAFPLTAQASEQTCESMLDTPSLYFTERMDTDSFYSSTDKQRLKIGSVAVESAISKLCTGFSDNNFRLDSSWCRRVNPATENSYACYYESDYGYFILNVGFADEAYINFVRWD